MPSRSGDPLRYRTPTAQKILADLFVRKWLTRGRRSVSVAWLKVVAEHAMGDALGFNHYVWIEQAHVEAALTRAGYRVRRTKAGPFVSVRPSSTAVDVWRFFKTGGAFPYRNGTSHRPKGEHKWHAPRS